jgi:hypothetical protein
MPTNYRELQRDFLARQTGAKPENIRRDGLTIVVSGFLKWPEYLGEEPGRIPQDEVEALRYAEHVGEAPFLPKTTTEQP